MEYIQLTMNDYLQSKEEIKKDLGGIVKSFVRIGWQLTRIDASRAYEMDGYKTIAEFAKAEYGMNPSGVSRFMKVYDKYSVPGDTPELKEQYRDFNFSQLTEMLQLPEEDHVMFQPEVKRESIREYQKFTKENENNPDNLLNWQKEPEDLLGKAILDLFRNNKEILNNLYGSEAYTAGDLKEMADIINPSGNCHYRYKTIFLMMYEYEKGIMISEFGKSPYDIKWEQFFSITQEIFKDAAAGSRTWENYFEPQIAPAQNPDQDEQIPGQDNVMNHPEYLPENKEESSRETEENTKEEPSKKETEIAPAQKEDFEPAPGNMTSLCYSCIHWSECNVKSNTVTDCNEYICKVEKTEEQRYLEEQAKIDRETKKKLKEKAQEEKMNHLPSESGPKTHYIRLASNYYDDVATGLISFQLRKNDKHYKVGDILDMMEFSEGRNTGRIIHAEITYILEDYTGLEDGYCILAIKVVSADE